LPPVAQGGARGGSRLVRFSRRQQVWLQPLFQTYMKEVWYRGLSRNKLQHEQFCWLWVSRPVLASYLQRPDFALTVGPQRLGRHLREATKERTQALIATA
jgi:hypothetical protein